MKLLDWYIARKYLSTFIFSIAILAAISCVIDYSEKVEDFVSRKAPVEAILWYYINFIPYIVNFLFPLFVFIATVFFTSKLAGRSEIIAILATGTDYRRFLKPYIVVGSGLVFISLLANHFVVPYANHNRIAFEKKYYKNVIAYSDHNVHLKISATEYIYLENYDFVSNMGYRFSYEKIDGITLKEKLMADRISYDSSKKEWVLYNVTHRYNDGLNERLNMQPELRAHYAFTLKDLVQDLDSKDAMTTPRLWSYIQQEKLRGRETLNALYIELHRRTATPFACFILTIMGVCIASTKKRGGGGVHLAIGIFVSAVFFMITQFSSILSTKAGFSPFLATWIPNLIFSCIAYLLYKKQIK